MKLFSFISSEIANRFIAMNWFINITGILVNCLLFDQQTIRKSLKIKDLVQLVYSHIQSMFSRYLFNIYVFLHFCTQMSQTQEFCFVQYVSVYCLNIEIHGLKLLSTLIHSIYGSTMIRQNLVFRCILHVNSLCFYQFVITQFQVSNYIIKYRISLNILILTLIATLTCDISFQLFTEKEWFSSFLKQICLLSFINNFLLISIAKILFYQKCTSTSVTITAVTGN